MTKLVWLALVLAVFMGTQSLVAQTNSEAATDSDRIRATGGSNNSAELYASGNDDAFGSYGVVTFNMTAAEFGIGEVTGINTVELNLTFNDRGFSDGIQIEIFFTADDFDSTYTGLGFDDTGANDPNGVNASHFTSLTSLGIYDLGFDADDSTNGGLNFDYPINLAAVETELVGEINAGSDFTLLLAVVDNSDDVTFSGVTNGFDPGEPTLTVSLTPLCLLGDVDLNGSSSFLDIAPFIVILSDGTFQCEADCDRSGAVNFFDISPFLAILAGF